MAGVLLFLVLLFIPSWAAAANRYVDPACTNGIATYNPTASAGNRCTGGSAVVNTTVMGAFTAASCGDTIHVRAGTYNERLVLQTKTCTAGSRLTMRGYLTERPIMRKGPAPAPDTWNTSGIATGSTLQYFTLSDMVLDGQDIPVRDLDPPSTLTNPPNDIHNAIGLILERLEVKNFPAVGFLVGGTQNLIIRDSVIHSNRSDACRTGTRVYGIYHASGTNTIIERVEIYNNPGGGIQAYPGPTTGLIVRSNNIHNNNLCSTATSFTGLLVGTDGISTNVGTQVYNNLVINNGADPNAATAPGIACYTSASGLKIWNNTVYGTKGVGIDVDAGCSSTVIQNNILYLNTGGGVTNAGSGTLSTNNLITNPNFVNAAGLDFHLNAGSPAINTGINLTACGFTTDYAGSLRPTGGGSCTAPTGSAWEIGAYEFGGAAPDTTPPAAPTGVFVSKLEGAH
jgi:hypothetical protein